MEQNMDFHNFLFPCFGRKIWHPPKLCASLAGPSFFRALRLAAVGLAGRASEAQQWSGISRRDQKFRLKFVRRNLLVSRELQSTRARKARVAYPTSASVLFLMKCATHVRVFETISNAVKYCNERDGLKNTESVGSEVALRLVHCEPPQERSLWHAVAAALRHSGWRRRHGERSRSQILLSISGSRCRYSSFSMLAIQMCLLVRCTIVLNRVSSILT